MESRTRWRKGEGGVREGVAGLVDALRQGIGAKALALFDDDRAAPDPKRDPGSVSFWDAFADFPCVDLDWQRPYAALRATGRFDETCACDAGHSVRGLLIHGRWVLIFVTEAHLPPGAAVALASGVTALAERLPPGKPPEEDDAAREHRDAPRALAGAARPPVWWLRRPRE